MPHASAEKTNKVQNWRAEAIQITAESPPRTTSSYSPLHEKPHSSKPSTSIVKTDTILSHAPGPKRKAGPSKPAPFKEFTLKPSDLPFTKEKLAESITLEEACGFLPYLMKLKRADLRIMEFEIDQITVDLQIALRNAKNVCVLLENIPIIDPENITSAKVQAHRLMYLLALSSRVFEQLDKAGRALKEGIREYVKQSGDYHSSIDILLEYIMERILVRCEPGGTYV